MIRNVEFYKHILNCKCINSDCKKDRIFDYANNYIKKCEFNAILIVYNIQSNSGIIVINMTNNDSSDKK
jgi:hypothetical protein